MNSKKENERETETDRQRGKDKKTAKDSRGLDELVLCAKSKTNCILGLFKSATPICLLGQKPRTVVSTRPMGKAILLVLTVPAVKRSLHECSTYSQKKLLILRSKAHSCPLSFTERTSTQVRLDKNSFD